MSRYKLKKTRKKSVKSVLKRVSATTSEVLINTIIIEESSLDDILKASRIIEAKIKGLDDGKYSKHTQVVRKIVAKANAGEQKATLSKINELIVEKNKQMNKPNQNTIELYKKIILES